MIRDGLRFISKYLLVMKCVSTWESKINKIHEKSAEHFQLTIYKYLLYKRRNNNTSTAYANNMWRKNEITHKFHGCWYINSLTSIRNHSRINANFKQNEKKKKSSTDIELAAHIIKKREEHKLYIDDFNQFHFINS